MSVLTGMVAKMGTDADEKKARLGDLFWYSVSEDIEVNRDELVKMFDDLGLDHDFLPNEIRPCDAFKRATSALQENRIQITEDGTQFANLLIRDVRPRGDVRRHLVQEIVDQQEKVLDYSEVASYEFCKETEDISFDILRHPVVSEILEEKIYNTKTLLEQLYPKYCNEYGGRHIREVIKNILDSANPTAVRPSGALYFVPNFHSDTLFKLEKLLEFLADLNPERTVECHTVEMYDAERHREMLAGKITNQMDEKVDELITKIGVTLQSSRGVKPAVAEVFYTEYRRMLKYTGEYEKLLEHNLEAARAKLEILKEQIQTVFDKIDVTGITDVPNEAEKDVSAAS